MSGPINCTGTLCIYPTTFIHLLLQPGDLVSKDFLSFSLPRKFTTEGLTCPHHCKTGMSFFSSSPSQNIEVADRCSCPLPGLQFVHHIESGRNKKKNNPHLQVLPATCQVFTKLQTSPIQAQHGTLRRNFVCILLFQAIISRTGEKYCCLFFVVFILWFFPRISRTQKTHTVTHVVAQIGNGLAPPRPSLFPNLKSYSQSISHD